MLNPQPHYISKQRAICLIQYKVLAIHINTYFIQTLKESTKENTLYPFTDVTDKHPNN